MQIFHFSVYIAFSNVISLFSVYIAFILYCFFLFFQTKVECIAFLLSLVTGPNGIFRFSVYITFFNVISLFSVYITFILYCFFMFFQTKIVYTLFYSH